MFNFSIDSLEFSWNGAHTVNVYSVGHEIDVFSLNYARNDYTKAEVMEYALDWLEESNSLE